MSANRPDPADPLVRRDSHDNLAPTAQFPGDFTASEAAEHFAGLATPEPRTTRDVVGQWSDDRRYRGTFMLVGGRRKYALTYDPKHGSWRVYMLAKNWKARKEMPDA